MGFIPYDYKNGHPDPRVYMETSAIGAIHVGTLLVLSSGKLAKATGTDQPQYVSMYEGTVSDGDVIPVIAITENTRFLTTFSATATSVKVGDRLTIHTDAEQVTATTGGCAEVSEIRGTASGDEVIVRFPAAAGAELAAAAAQADADALEAAAAEAAAAEAAGSGGSGT